MLHLLADDVSGGSAALHLLDLPRGHDQHLHLARLRQRSLSEAAAAAAATRIARAAAWLPQQIPLPLQHAPQQPHLRRTQDTPSATRVCTCVAHSVQMPFGKHGWDTEVCNRCSEHCTQTDVRALRCAAGM